MESALRSRLLITPGVAALVSDIAWITRPQSGDLPAVVLQKVSPDRAYTMDGAGHLHGEDVQFDIWAKSFTAATAIRGALIAELECGAAADGVAFLPAFLNSERQSGDRIDGIGAVARISLDLTIWWKISA